MTHEELLVYAAELETYRQALPRLNEAVWARGYLTLSAKLQERELKWKTDMLRADAAEAKLQEAKKAVSVQTSIAAIWRSKFAELTVKLQEVQAERDALREKLEEAAAEIETLRVWQQEVSALMVAEKASHGEIVKACPHCHMHDPGWDEMAGCYRCINCCQTSDAVEHWQRVSKGPHAE